MGEKWGKMGKKWVRNEVTGVQKTVLMHASAHLVCGGPALVWHFFCVGVTGAGAGQGSSLERAPARLAICGPGMEDEPCRVQPPPSSESSFIWALTCPLEIGAKFGEAGVEQVGNQGGRHSGHRRTTGFGGTGRHDIDYELSKVVGAFHPVSLAAFTGVDGVGSA